MPFSYQGKLRGDGDKPHSTSQSLDANLSHGISTVEKLLAQKGGEVISVKANALIGDAIVILKERRIGALVVTNDHGELVGIISERDIVRCLAEEPGDVREKHIEDIMTKAVVTCHPSDAMISVLQKMTDGRFRHMPVMEGAKLVGLVTIGDMVNFRLKELEYESLKMKQMIVG
jgi:CBS domain-containing protein